MSFGIFEAATAEDLNHTRRKKLAGDRLAQAAAEVDHKLGPMLAKSTSVNDYHDRVRLAEKDFRNIVGKYLEGDSGFIAVAKKLEPHYTKRRSRTASRRRARRKKSYTPGEEVFFYNDDGIDPTVVGIVDNYPAVDPSGGVFQDSVELRWLENDGEMQDIVDTKNLVPAGPIRNSRRKRSFDMDAPRAYTSLDEAIEKEIRIDSLGIPYQNVKWDDLSEEVFEQTPKGNWQLRPDYRETRENFGEPLMDAIYRNTTASRRVANTDLEDLREIVQGYGVKTRKRRGRDGFTFPAASGANGAISVRPNGEIVVETLFGGGAGGMQSVYSPNEVDLVEDWIEKTVGGSYRLSRRKKANGYSPEQAADIISRENPGVSFEQAFHTVNNAMGNSGMSHLSEAELVLFLREMKRISNRRKQANPWRSPDDALVSGYFPGWQTDHNEDGWWQINSPDGSDALVGEEDGSYTMRLDAETPEEAWAERMNFDEALQESEALHYRKNGGRRRRANAVGQVVDLSGLDQLPVGSVVKTLADDGAASYELEKTGDNQWLWARAGMTVDNNYIGKATVEFIP